MLCGGKRRTPPMASLLSLHLPNPKPIRACITTTTTTTQTPQQTLEQRFGRKGIKFTESGDSPAVDLTVRNGSSLHLTIPDGIITSYKPKVNWKDDGFEEVLHTVPSGGSVRGGIGLVLNSVSKSVPDGPPWCASDWIVKDTDSDSIDAVQIELRCNNNEDGSLEINYIVSLYPTSVATAVVVKNTGSESIELTSAILSHLKFKSQSGSAIRGLTGCSYCAHPPLPSSFGILSPADAMVPEAPALFSFLGSQRIDEKQDLWTKEDDLYTILKGKLSRVYSAPPKERLKRIYRTPPSKYETIDQGSGLGFRFIRMGFDDIYVCSPGSLSAKYGEDYFICTGPASMLVPVVLNPGEQWRGAQVIEHDNL